MNELKEEWKPIDIPNLDKYLVSNHGRIKNIRNNTLLTPSIKKNYCKYTLSSFYYSR